MFLMRKLNPFVPNFTKKKTDTGPDWKITLFGNISFKRCFISSCKTLSNTIVGG